MYELIVSLYKDTVPALVFVYLRMCVRISCWYVHTEYVGMQTSRYVHLYYIHVHIRMYACCALIPAEVQIRHARLLAVPRSQGLEKAIWTLFGLYEVHFNRFHMSPGPLFSFLGMSLPRGSIDEAPDGRDIFNE